MEYKKLDEIIEFNPTEVLKKGAIYKKIPMEKLGVFSKHINSFDVEEYRGGMKFRNGDTLLARITPCLENGKTSKVTILDENEVGFGSTEYIVMRSKKNISDEDFIFYLAISPEFRNIAIKSMTGTSGRQRVQLDVVKSTEMLVPTYEEQIKIGKILSSIDNKIEINNKINDNLYELNKLVYKEKIDSIKCNYSQINYKKLDDIVIVNSRGLSPSYVDSGISVINQSCIRNGIIHEEKIQYHDINKKVKQEYYYKKYDILINSMGVGTLGRISQVGQLNKDYLIHSCISIIRANEEIINQFILGQELINIQKEIENMAQGTTGQTSLSNKELGKLEIFIPPLKIQNEVSLILKANIDTITHNLVENEHLKQLRDILLPKLLNGEIDLDKIKI